MSLLIDERVYRCRGAAARLFKCFSAEVLLDGAAGTGKTRAILERIDGLCELFPGLRALVCRATRTSCTESILVTLERDVLRPDMPGMLRDISRGQRDAYEYENGSVIVVGGLDHPERLYSTEWDLVYVAEAIEITEDSWERFARAMRNHRIPLSPQGGPLREGETPAVGTDGRPLFWTQRIADCNPGAPGHWLNQRALSGRMTRLKSRHEDNPSITEDFLDGLKALTGHRRARLYEGRWVSAEGSVFPEFSEERNVCRPFPDGWPSDWPVWVGYDSGYDHPAAVVFYGVAPNEQPYIIDEIYQSGLTLEDLGASIVQRARGRNVQRWLADPRDVFKKTAHASGQTIADYMRERYQLHFTPWPAKSGQEVHNQIEAVRNLVRGNKPLMVWSNCPKTIGEFQSWSYKRTADGSIPAGDDAFEDRNNHALDAVLGIVATLPVFTSPRVRFTSE